MKTIIKSFRVVDDPLSFSQALNIRNEVFIIEQHVDPALEHEFDEEAQHYLLLLENIPVATARWRFTTKGIKLERFATLRDHRMQGLGSILLEKLMGDTIKYNRLIYLHAQLPVISFYEKHGFIKVGEVFREADIDHFVMMYKSGKLNVP